MRLTVAVPYFAISASKPSTTAGCALSASIRTARVVEAMAIGAGSGRASDAAYTAQATRQTAPLPAERPRPSCPRGRLGDRRRRRGSCIQRQQCFAQHDGLVAGFAARAVDERDASATGSVQQSPHARLLRGRLQLGEVARAE